MQILKYILILIILFNLNFKPSYSSIENTIIAKVGKNIITLHDLENRINTSLILSNKIINQENINKIKNITLKKLIDLEVKRLELKNYNIPADKRLVENHMQKISQNLNINHSNLVEFFKINEINYELFRKEVETELLWNRLMIELYSSKINISQEQIDAEVKNIISNKKKNIEFKLAEIEIDFNEDTKLKLINEIKESIKNDGFSNTATKYSIAPSSLTGGEIGWININSINNNLLNKIKKLKIGEISEAIIVAEKIVFLKILDKREINNNVDINLVKKNVLEKKKNELLNLYSTSHLSKRKNNTLIKIQ